MMFRLPAPPKPPTRRRRRNDANRTGTHAAIRPPRRAAHAPRAHRRLPRRGRGRVLHGHPHHGPVPADAHRGVSAQRVPTAWPSFRPSTPSRRSPRASKISIWAAIVATAPVILWQLLAFFLPALKPNERKWFMPTFAAAVVLFIVGTVFCYLIILNPAFQWLTDQAMGLGDVAPRMASYIDIIIKFELGFRLCLRAAAGHFLPRYLRRGPL